MNFIFLYDMICLLAGIPAVFQLTGCLMASPAYVRVSEGDENVSGRLTETYEPVIQTLFRPTARNGTRHRLPNREAGAVK
jgi:hypothetical protein